MVSIIIPVYNIDKYIVECLESIYCQTYKDFEVIIIDDGSTDKTYQYCSDYIANKFLYRNFKIIKKTNGGVVSARIEGLSYACGDWIMFVDGDDTLEPKSLEILTNYITTDLNIIIGTFNYYISGKKRSVNNLSLGKYSAEEYIDLILLGKVYVAPWAKLYRRALLIKQMLELPRSIKNKEDLIMNMRVACSQKGNILFINDVIYNYRYGRVDSALTKYLLKMNLKYELKIKDYVVGALKENSLYNTHKKYISYYYFNLLWYLKSTYHGLRIDEYNELLEMLKKSKIKSWTLKSLVKFIIINILLIKEKLLIKLNRYNS